MGGGVTPADASALMKRGIALLEANTPASLTESLAYFERAIDLRRKLLPPGDHWAAYLLAASWMNRGDALTRLGGADRLSGAVRSYDEALTVLRAVPPDAETLYRRRHAIAWINRGLSLHEQRTAESMEAAIGSFEEAVAMVRDHPEHTLLLACAWMNRGNSLLQTQPVRAPEAQASAIAALALVKESEEHDPMAAEASLKAQIIVCQSVAEALADAPNQGEPLEQVCIATDAMEAGLKLARRWEERGESRFDPLLTSLLRFGVAIYRRYQPQFLTEFVLEHLRPSDGLERHALAADALAAEARRLPPDGFASVNAPRFHRLLETLRALRLTEQRLAEQAEK